MKRSLSSSVPSMSTACMMISVHTAFGMGMAIFFGTFFTMLLALGIIIGFKPSLMILIISAIVCLASADDTTAKLS